jgi:hypothetical protein
MPVVPLERWLPQAMSETGFFAFARPFPDRPLSSWFLAATPAHPVLEAWWLEIERFWSMPRKLAHYPGGVPADPVATVAPGTAAPGLHPYAWFHYLFQYLLDTRSEIAELWSRTPSRPADGPHKLQFLFDGQRMPSLFQVMEAASSAPVHKLNWRAVYPLDLLAALGGPQLPVFPA